PRRVTGWPEPTRPPDTRRTMPNGRLRRGGGPVPRANGPGASATATAGYRHSPQPGRPGAAATGTACGGDDSFVSRLYAEHGAFLLVFVQRLTGGDLHWAED